MSRQIQSLGFALLRLTAKSRINQSLQTSSVLNLIDEDDTSLILKTPAELRIHKLFFGNISTLV
jgi:hypothetical protein